MLSFDTALANQLKLKNTTSFWVLKLYYNKEDNQAFQSNGTTANLLAEALDTSETGVDVDYGAAFVAGDFIKIDSEVMKVASISSNTLTVVRGAKNTTIATHNDNSIIYYDNWIGLSDQHREDGSDIYYGLVSSWGKLNHSIDFFNFKAGSASTKVKLVNTENSYKGERISNLLSSYNFGNRKWELFQNTSGLNTLDTSARMIGSGVITGDAEYNEKFISFSLRDFTSKYLSKTVPKTTVELSTYPNAPVKNIGKPIPVAYGTFKDRTYTSGSNSVAVSTVPSSYFGRHMTYKFPAIITNQWYVGGATTFTGGYVKANADSQAINELFTDNVYIYNDGLYASCNDSSSAVAVTASSGEVSFRGQSWRLFLPLNNEYNTASTVLVAGSGVSRVDTPTNASDGSFGTTATFTFEGAQSSKVAIYGFPKVPTLGKIDSIKLLLSFGTITNGGNLTSGGFIIKSLANATAVTPATNAEQYLNVATANFSSDNRETWDLENSYPCFIITTSGDYSFQVEMVALEITYAPESLFDKQLIENYEHTETSFRNSNYTFQGDTEAVTETFNLSRTITVSTPTVSEYVYCSGSGRKYGAWIDTINGNARNSENGNASDPGYAVNNLIENPVYIIEDILRTECGLDSSTIGKQIDIETFDATGSEDDGNLLYSLGIEDDDAVSDGVKFAFSQYKFITAKDLIDRIAKLMGVWVFVSGNGKVKMATRKRREHSHVKIINYEDIKLKDISLTPINNVRNDITVNYDYDYGSDQTLSSRNSNDATSAGGSSSGYAIEPSDLTSYMKFSIDANEVLSYTTAGRIADMYLAYFKDRFPVIKFECLRPYYNDLEVGDSIKFENWDSKIKIYGTAMATDYYIITNIGKTPTGCSIQAIKVS